jgi:hypothetical protein
MVEQLICNQQVAGSSPIASFSAKVGHKIAKVSGFLAVERFPSGQREQTVNLPAQPSEVRTLPSPPNLKKIYGAVDASNQESRLVRLGRDAAVHHAS